MNSSLDIDDELWKFELDWSMCYMLRMYIYIYSLCLDAVMDAENSATHVTTHVTE